MVFRGNSEGTLMRDVEEKIWQFYKEWLLRSPTSEKAKILARELPGDVVLAVYGVILTPGYHDLKRDEFLKKFHDGLYRP